MCYRAKMTWKFAGLSALLFAVFCTAGLTAIASDEAAGAQSGKVKIIPESFLRGYDPVTVFFAEALGPAGGGPEDHPERFVKVEPPQPGEFRWADAKTLIFRPTVAWPPLAEFRLDARGASRKLTTMMVPPTATEPPAGSEGLDQIEEIVLTFKEPLPKEKLAQMLAFELRPLPGVGQKGSSSLGPGDFSIKAMERASMNAPASYVVRFKQPIGGGVRLLLTLRLSLGGAKGSVARYSYSTREPFRVISFGCHRTQAPPAAPGYQEEPYGEGIRDQGYEYEGEGEGYAGEGDGGYGAGYGGRSGDYREGSQETPAGTGDTLQDKGAQAGLLPVSKSGSRYGQDQAINCGCEEPKISILFSSEPAPLSLSAVRALVRFSPSLNSMTFEQAGRYLNISGKFERETLYRAAIEQAPIRDKAGRTLELGGPSEFSFFFPKQPPFLRWATSQGIVERHGPQMFPMAGRGESQLDLRIYKIDPLDRSFWPFPGGPVTVDESERPPGPGEEPQKGGDMGYYIDAQQLALHLKLLGSPPVSKVVPVPVREGGSSTAFGLPLKESLKAISGPDQPGTYLVGFRRLNEESKRHYIRIQVTDLSLTTVEESRAVVFLVTSLRSGAPVPGASVKVEGIPYGTDETEYKPFISGVTDETGRFRYEHKSRIEGDILRISVRKDNDSLVLMPSDPPYSFSNDHWYGPSGIWLEWLKDDPHKEDEESQIVAHLFTERPVYRPEEEVYIKGYIRLREKGRLEYPPKKRYELLITEPGGKEWLFPAEMTPEGSFAKTFAERDLPTGQYRVAVRDVENRTVYGSTDFKMEAYKIPRFEVKLHGADWVPMDKEFEISATSSYYAGGRVVGQSARWRVTQFPLAFSPKAVEGYFFSSDERFSRSTRWDVPGAIEKLDKTDDTGGTKITVNPALEIDGRPRRYIFELTVTGPDDQTVSAVKEVKALPPFVLGLKVERFIKGSKQIRPSIIAVDGNDEILAGQEVTVRLLQRQWHSHLKETDFASGQARYSTDVVEQEILTQQVTTGTEAVTLDLQAPEAGIYIVELSSRDALGRLQVVQVDLFVAGDEPLAWKKPQQNIFETASDKKEYAPGETAQILIKSPFQNARGLAVIENQDGLAYREFTVTGGKAIYDLPIRNEHAPRVPVHFVLMRGRLEGTKIEGNLDLGKPTTMASTIWIKVKPEGNRLDLKVEHPEKASPGQKITVKLHLRDGKGNPLPGEVTLWLVDQAVLSLGKVKNLDPIPSLVKDVRSHISIKDTRNRVIGELVTEESPGGGGSEEEGSDLFGKVTVRKRFKTVPYYNPRIMVDASGDTEVTFELSEDLTTFKVKAVACSGSERFGHWQSSLPVRLPVIVQPALPRFARVGDSFSAGGIGRIIEGEGGAGSCQIQAVGASVTGETKMSLQWAKDTPEKLYFPLVVDTPKDAAEEGGAKSELTVRVAVTRDSDGASDAFETKIPVLDDRDPIQSTEFKELTPGAPVSLPEPKEAVRPGSLTRSVYISDQGALLKMVSGLNYLFSYPHICTEQYVSRAFPAIALKDLAKAIDMRAAQGKADELFDETVAYLAKALQPDGLYSYWPGRRGQVSLTAYVVEFLAEAKKVGYKFDPKLLDKPVAALKQALRSDYSGFIDGYAFTERAEALNALSAAGQFDVAYGSELAKKAKFVDLYTEAKILQAYNAGQKGGADMSEELRKDLWDNTLFKLREGREVYGGMQFRCKTWGGQVLASEIKAQASVIRALYPKDSGNPKLAMVVDDLVQTGQGDGWGNTNTNAQALLALRDVLKSKREGVKAREVLAEVGGEKQTLKLGGQAQAVVSRFSQPGPGKVTLAKGGDGDKTYARFNLSYIPQATGEKVPARSSGFVVRREVIRVPKGDSAPVREWIDKEGGSLSFAIGDVVEEHIQVVIPEAMNYVAVVAPFAAGFDPMNPNLATAPQEARPSGKITLEPAYSMYLDDEVRFYYESIPAGTYDFYYRLRASTAGSFSHPAASAEMMYNPSKRGNSPGLRVEVK